MRRVCSKKRLVDGVPGGDLALVVDGKSEKLLASSSAALFRDVVAAGLGTVTAGGGPGPPGRLGSRVG